MKAFRLLDFGIAKLLNVEEEATHTGLRAMTPVRLLRNSWTVDP
ncbi:hypothetical protein [Dokdonella sp.]